MISNTKKFCKNGCNGRYVFAHDLCIYCYRKEYVLPKLIEKQTNKRYLAIQPNSKKRVLLNKEYERRKLENNILLKSKCKFRCFFTGKPFSADATPEYHHTIGRDGELLDNMDYCFPCNRKPHREYHDLNHDPDKLLLIPWYYPWLERMKTELPILYFKEIDKIKKAVYKPTKFI